MAEWQRDVIWKMSSKWDGAEAMRRVCRRPLIALQTKFSAYRPTQWVDDELSLRVRRQRASLEFPCRAWSVGGALANLPNLLQVLYRLDSARRKKRRR